MENQEKEVEKDTKDISGIYISSKTGSRYILLHLARLNETKEMLVIYQSVLEGTIYARSYTEFFETIQLRDENLPRFIKATK